MKAAAEEFFDETRACDNCGSRCRVAVAHRDPVGRSDHYQVDSGAHWYLGGSYGEFVDSIGPEVATHRFILCHDCCVRVFEALPGISDNLAQDMTFWHESATPGKPCCRWGHWS